jgi:subtilisin
VTWNVDKVGYGDGSGKTAWIMDTGIDMDHPDLNVDKSRSRSFISDVSSPEDDNGHGTHVAGIVGAKNNTIGTLGVASGATVVSLKILDKEGNGRLSTALKALSYIKSNGKAGDAINISLTLDEISESLETEIRSVANNGMYVAIAAGNDSKDASTFSPARTAGANIYTVSAVDSLNQFANFSNYGAQAIDYAAPGVRILSTYIDGKYAIISGTSMASPHVAGLLLINQGKINANGFALNDPDGKPDPLAHQ